MLTIDIRDLIKKYTYTKSQVLDFLKNDKLLVSNNLSNLHNIGHKFKNEYNGSVFSLDRTLSLSMMNYEKNYKKFKLKESEYNDDDKFILIKDIVFEKISNIFRASDFYNSLSIIALNEICLDEHCKGLFEYLLSSNTYSSDVNKLIESYEKYLNNQDDIYTIKMFKDSKFKNKVFPKKIKVTRLLREYYLGVDSELIGDSKIKKIKDDVLSETDKYLICFSKEDVNQMLSIIKEHGLETLNNKINKSHKRIRFLEDEIKREEKKIEELSDKSIYLEEELNYILGL